MEERLTHSNIAVSLLDSQVFPSADQANFAPRHSIERTQRHQGATLTKVGKVMRRHGIDVVGPHQNDVGANEHIASLKVERGAHDPTPQCGRHLLNHDGVRRSLVVSRKHDYRRTVFVSTCQKSVLGPWREVDATGDGQFIHPDPCKLGPATDRAQRFTVSGYDN